MSSPCAAATRCERPSDRPRIPRNRPRARFARLGPRSLRLEVSSLCEVTPAPRRQLRGVDFTGPTPYGSVVVRDLSAMWFAADPVTLATCRYSDLGWSSVCALARCGEPGP